MAGLWRTRTLLLLSVGGVSGALPPPCAGQGVWKPTTTTAAPSARGDHTAAWTGSKMIVWGGDDGAVFAASGGVYDPVTDGWTATAATGAPTARAGHSAVWTGSKMIVWGGSDGVAALNTGGIYDPASDAWRPTSVTGAPSARTSHKAVWTGSKMIVWGGTNYTMDAFYGTGGVYDPVTDAWTPVSTRGAPAARRGHTAVWTGSRMIVWGGQNDIAFLNTGGIYDPATNTWAPTSPSGAPDERFNHTAVWTGTKMIVWGGLEWDMPTIGTGGIYDPATNTWAPTTQTLAPVSRSSNTAAWTGSRMVVWGGHCDGLTPCADVGYLYDPGTDTWTRTSTSNEPVARTAQSAVWTGSQMIVWGGFVPTVTWGPLDTGGVYENHAPDASGRDFYTVTPCRAVDTRNATGPAGGPALASGWTRRFPVTGVPCGIPATAVAVSVNATAVGARAAGNLILFPGDWISPPPVSNLSFTAGVTRANNAVVTLATDGTGTIQVKNGSSGSVHLVLDVNGYFQ